jgi:hypothetical protein
VGTVFKLAPNGTETVLHSFAGYPVDGNMPLSGLIIRGGFLYGTTDEGGTHADGTVFRVKE